MSPSKFSLKADKGREGANTSTPVPLSLRPPNYIHATKMEAYYKAESDMTMPLDQHMSLTRSGCVVQLDIGLSQPHSACIVTSSLRHGTPPNV